MPDPIKLKFDGPLDIATTYEDLTLEATKANIWDNNENWMWSDFLQTKISEAKADKKAKAGAFVGALLVGRRRTNKTLVHRQLLAIDIDEVPKDAKPWKRFKEVYSCAAAMYTTHNHSATSPSIRILVPMSEGIDNDRYEAIARKIAETIGIDMVCKSTFRPAQPMFFPTSANPAKYRFEIQDGEWLYPEDILDMYDNWQDPTTWPIQSKESTKTGLSSKELPNPKLKPGIIGAFNEIFEIDNAIETHIPEIYQPAPSMGPDRWSYCLGSSTGGLQVFRNEYVYSWHSTDPLGDGHEYHSFDMVRIHKFGEDDKGHKDTDPTTYPSFKKMVAYAEKIPAVAGEVTRRKKEQALEDMKAMRPEMELIVADNGSIETKEYTPPEGWENSLKRNKGKIVPTVLQIRTILKNDEYLRKLFAYDEFEHQEVAVVDRLPWREVTPETRQMDDVDDFAIFEHLESIYEISSRIAVKEAFMLQVRERTVHPVREYLRSRKWDGVPRVENVFIKHLGAEDNPFNRAVTRKTLCAAVGRIMNPGCKFDYVLTLISEKQGLGKSRIVRDLGMKWSSDSFHSVEGRDAFEILQGSWIFEASELAALKHNKIEQIKQFFSKQSDKYRVAYKKRSEMVRRQCIFIATTNKTQFLKDDSGNRRFWPMVVSKYFSGFEPGEVDQIWAEAVVLYDGGKEDLYLSREIEMLATQVQLEHTEVHEWTETISEYLDQAVPAGWEHYNLYDRRSLAQGGEIQYADPKAPRTAQRMAVCAKQMWEEIFNGTAKDHNFRYAMQDIKAIMRNMEGWHSEDGKLPGYGKQRFFARNTSNENQ
jgi:putative DNA primase/helicase